jgi:hypothetical protein
VIVDRHGKDLFGFALADDIVIQPFADLMRNRQFALVRFLGTGIGLGLFANNVIT